MNYKLKKISGDASFREFYRLQKGKNTSIIVQANKEKFKNLITYIAVNKILTKYKIYAPKLISNHYEHNIIEISDLGQKSFYNSIIKKKNKFKDYKDLIKILIKLQNIKLQRNYRLGKFKINFQNYSIKNLHKESDLFFDWYLKYCFKISKPKKIKGIIKNELTKIYKKLYFQNNTFVHRDFHASNIMINKNKLGLIDSQDAIIGNPLYDVASLIDDVRIKLPSNLQEKLLNFYYNKSKLKKEKYKNLKNDFEILSVQRNLKILGIFVRLFKRDGKPNYLKYLPYTWSLIERRLKNPIFKKLNLLFNKHLKIKKLKKINNL
ncbi:aminoglycoside phosphotransferase family protein [Candidatus Pelagibacter communis]|uniref:aminoglycoside phosphotransferase family protein n=1 Tax=Pelagibacter ubique TaxID=198252 RepID=UPI00094D1519|nr:phosphotransferase [Candidatus Pelagibacter ubique]